MTILIFLFYSAFSIIFLRHFIPVWSTAIPGGLEDTRLFLWNAWWFRYAIHTLHTSPYFTKFLFYPFGSSLAAHDYPLWTNVITWAGQSAGLNVIASSNTWFLLTWVLNAFFAYLLVWEVVRVRAPAVVAGLYVMTNSFLLARAMQNWGYWNLFGLALFLWLWMRAGRTKQTRDYVTAGAALAFTAACQYYYLIFGGVIWFVGVLADVVPYRMTCTRGTVKHGFLILATIAAALSGWIIFMQPAPLVISRVVIGLDTPSNTLLVMWICLIGWIVSHFRFHLIRKENSLAATLVRERLMKEGALIITALVGLTPLIWETIKMSFGGGYPRQSILWKTHLLGANLLAVFLPNPIHAVWGPAVSQWFWNRGLNPQEEAARIGWVCLAVVLASRIWKVPEPKPRRWLILAVGSTIMALGVYLHWAQWNTWMPLPFYVWRLIPILNNVRVPERWMAVGSLAWGVVLALALCRLAWKKNWNLTALCAVVGALILIENWPGIPVAPPPPDSAVYEKLRSLPPGAVLPLPLALRDSGIVAGDSGMPWVYLGAQVYHQHPILGGCIGRISRNLIKAYKADPYVNELLTLEEGKPPTGVKIGKAEACQAMKNFDVTYALRYTDALSTTTTHFIDQTLPMKAIQKDSRIELDWIVCR